MNSRVGAAVIIAILAAGCTSVSPPPPTVSVGPVTVRPQEAHDVTAAPPAAAEPCDREASLPPGPLPAAGEMPPGSTMAVIARRGRLVVGVDQNTYGFGFRDPTTGRIEGFDIDVAREIARAVFGDPDRIDLRVVDARDRETALMSGQVDVVVRTYSITCERRRSVDFSTVYFVANQRILAPRGTRIDTADDLSGRRVCAVTGTTSLSNLVAINPRPFVIGVTAWTDCLVMLQQNQVDAISTDDAVLAGLAEQDPTVEIVGPSLEVEPYGVGVGKYHEDLVRFVNGVLERMRLDGTWDRLYDRWLTRLGPSPGPPAATYGGS
ncbi:glutamate ABC transporter substrate-binding protein [Mycolicibacterium psychrotolerans]|uniref:ABC transporter substrate-binding protein n=1 Tax=Mycolicibacterium psychrotolerans TaxID=216929 RepID=A0A7I7M5X0_9MYCO|nr:glutamate ABC transporter substrate-binding protein [Mycolicibacterium psychrotolerans]BBX67588.1 ABC transporter substrate-binding protein [Mycolicibacterium psychrotolerans]